MVNYLKYRYYCAAFFGLLVVAGFGGYFYNLNKYGSAYNFSVDFTGGTQMLVKFAQPITSDQVRSVLGSKGYTGLELREFSNNEILIRIQKFDDDIQGVGTKIAEALQEDLKDNTVEIREVNSVGSAVGENLRWGAIKAIIISLILMLIYVAIRFQFAFSVGAVFALFHDALVIAVYFLLTRQEVSIDVIGAILMVLGYSVNDTIVIFSRIRENLAVMGNAKLYDIVNTSINQTMSRTIRTSLSTALVVFSLLLFGGEMLRGLSITLLLGIVFGTYSSIFVASPVMMYLYRGEK
jgi:preprotein translocase subunit SecF